MKKGSNSKNSKKDVSYVHILQQVTYTLDKYPEDFFTENELRIALNLKEKKHTSALLTALEQLIEKGAISKNNKGYFTNRKQDFVEGILDHVNPRMGYVIVEGREKDIIIKSNDIGQALDGDRVKVLLYPLPPKITREERQEGQIVEVIQRKRTDFVGRFEEYKRMGFVIADGKKIFTDFAIAPNATMGAKNGEKVVIRLTKWGPNAKNPEAEVIKILGKAGDNETEMHSIMAEFGLPVEFPLNVLKESENISTKISDLEIAKRRDFRNILTFTIDPVDAKDFDDALSIKTLENGHYEIGVHIADVSHYVQLGTDLDKDAYERATSVYLVDRCVPMLPERLSNELCSLRPNEDKLTFSAVFEIDIEGKIYDKWFGRTVIHSDKRFAYEDVQEIMDNNAGEYLDELKTMNTIAHRLREKRFKNGSINFETVEVKFLLDEKGKPLAVIPKVRKDSHKMIEDFMLLANKSVAEFVFNYQNGKEKNVMVYRTHDNPDVEKLRNFSLFVTKFGYKIEAESNNIAQEINRMIDEVQGKPEQNIVESLAIRSMAKAKYTTDANGHFGLAFAHYSHFTSPIRRYPDLMTHRLLQMYLDNHLQIDRIPFEAKCKHSSAMEKLASEAERASIKYKQVEFMAQMIGQEFDGIVSGVTEWGIFVEIEENKCEGLVRFQDIKSEYFDVEAAAFRAIGRKTGKIITLGDKMKVKVKLTDLEKRTIDLTMIEDSIY